MLGEGAHTQVGLEASTRPATAQRPIGIRAHVPDFAGPGTRPAHRSMIDDDASANAHLARHVHEGRRTTGHPRSRVGNRVGRQVRFVRDDHRVQVGERGK